MQLPARQKPIYFKDKGERSRETFEGNFTFKTILTQSEIIDVAVLMDTYNRGSKTLPSGVALLNRAFAELDVRIVKSPSWWKDSNDGRDLLDTNIVFGVFNKAMEAEKSYEEDLNKADEEAEKAIEESKEKKPKKDK